MGQRDGRDKGKKGIKDSKWISQLYRAKELSVDCGILRDGREDSCWERDIGTLRLRTRNPKYKLLLDFPRSVPVMWKFWFKGLK